MEDLDFSDLKKKKKKKEIPSDLGEEGSSTPATKEANGNGEAAAGDDLDFSDLKKKKKSTKKKAALDLEAFERELADTPAKDDGDIDGEHLDALDEADLGDDPFGHGGEGGGHQNLDTISKAWLGSDRDYTYTEVSTLQHFM